ncbi:BTAD domain-containing putative transcriptional regulator [Streptomyces sp. NPDC018019]|uniref:BTAD domain-containing putative transcriptional regulator n=1 Tax=Streptomyces sp. NPDC018019 TaxID=3365030 RepID=UPI0037BAE409
MDGEPLAGAPGPYCATWRARLEDRRLALLETRLGLDPETGRNTELVAELTALTAEHPLRHRLRELLTPAQHRGECQAEAPTTDPAPNCDTASSTEPSDRDRRVLRAVPRRSPTKKGRPGHAGAGAAQVRPAQLPADARDFTGRAALVEELGAQLAAAGGPVMVISAVGCIGGVGKTALAVHVAHAARSHFPDGQLYVDLQGTGRRPADPGTVLWGFLQALGVPDCAVPGDWPTNWPTSACA